MTPAALLTTIAAQPFAFRAPAPPTHGTREPARPASSPGRAVDFDRHRPPCQTCRCSPCVCDPGTMGGQWIAGQIERANGFNAVAYRSAMTTLPRHAGLRDRIYRRRRIDWSAVVLVACAAAIVALSMTCLFAAEWLHGLIYD